MIYSINGEQPFQVNSDSFSVSPSESGYDLYLSADGVNYSNFATVASGVTRQFTNMNEGNYYRLMGNTSLVKVNWERSCGGGGGGGTAGVSSLDGQTGALTLKTVNGNALLGSGNIVISGGSGGGDYVIVDDLSAITNPVEGMVAYIPEKGVDALSATTAATDFPVYTLSISDTSEPKFPAATCQYGGFNFDDNIGMMTPFGDIYNDMTDWTEYGWNNNNRCYGYRDSESGIFYFTMGTTDEVGITCEEGVTSGTSGTYSVITSGPKYFAIGFNPGIIEEKTQLISMVNASAVYSEGEADVYNALYELEGGYQAGISNNALEGGDEGYSNIKIAYYNDGNGHSTAELLMHTGEFDIVSSINTGVVIYAKAYFREEDMVSYTYQYSNGAWNQINTTLLKSGLFNINDIKAINRNQYSTVVYVDKWNGGFALYKIGNDENNYTFHGQYLGIPEDGEGSYVFKGRLSVDCNMDWDSSEISNPEIGNVRFFIEDATGGTPTIQWDNGNDALHGFLEHFFNWKDREYNRQTQDAFLYYCPDDYTGYEHKYYAVSEKYRREPVEDEQEPGTYSDTDVKYIFDFNIIISGVEYTAEYSILFEYNSEAQEEEDPWTVTLDTEYWDTFANYIQSILTP